MSKKPYDNLSKQTILIICAHKDDETFAITDTIARQIQADDQVYVMAMWDTINTCSQKLNPGSSLLFVERHKSISKEQRASVGVSMAGAFQDLKRIKR